MLRRKFPLATVMLSARSASNDCVPGQASEAYSPWWRDRKQWVRSRGRAMLLQRETMKCFGKSEETNSDKNSLYFVACKAPFILVSVISWVSNDTSRNNWGRLTSPLSLLISVDPSLHVMGYVVNWTVYTFPHQNDAQLLNPRVY